MSNYQIKEIIQGASNMLQKYFDGNMLNLSNPEVIKDSVRNLVLRCGVNSDDSQIPQSVIIKKILHTPKCGYTDWASLDYLKGSGLKSLVPEYYCGDQEMGFFIMEDLGDQQSLDDILRETDFQEVEQSLISLVKQTAKLHAATLGQKRGYQKIRDSLPESGLPIRQEQAKNWDAGLLKVLRWFEAVDITTQCSLRECLDRINHLYLEPGPYLSFTHGDMAPTNNLFLPDRQAFLIDFEYGGDRHALYDLTAWNVLCPLPEELVEVMNNTYRQELFQHSPIALDEELYHQGYAYISAWRALAMLSWIPCEILEENRPWVEDWTMRQAVLAALHRLNQSCQKQVELTPLLDMTRFLEEELVHRWGTFNTILPQWPALL